MRAASSHHQLAGSPGPRLSQLPRLLAADPWAGPASLAEHIGRYGLPLSPGLDQPRRKALIDEVAQSGLAGRGGAGFPTARKLTAVAARRRALVVANGTEGEPASAKDKVLLAVSPHLVLDGAVLAAEIVGADEVTVVVHHAVREIVDAAADERRRAGFDRVRIQVETGAGGFVAGEASAVVHWIERGVATPTLTPPRLSERGLRGRPTLVQNVETLAHLALIARFGAAWFREAGTPQEPGSMLVTILGAVPDPGVHEVAIGTPIDEVLGRAGPASDAVAGHTARWLLRHLDRAAAAATLPYSSAGLATLGATVGGGLIAALPGDACGLAETARVVRYLADESAGQCGPCLFGLSAVAGEISGSRTGAHPLSAISGAGSAKSMAGAHAIIPTARYGWSAAP